MIEYLLELDAKLLLIIQSLRLPILNEIVMFFTSLNNGGIIVIAIILLFLLVKKLRFIGMMMAVSLILEAVLNNLILKNLIGRTRPYEMIDGLMLLCKEATDFSFPSGHTGSAFAIAGVIWLLLPKKYGITAIVLSILMGLSRLYVGIHYPTDVVVGVFLGIFTSWLTVKIIFKEKCRNISVKK